MKKALGIVASLTVVGIFVYVITVIFSQKRDEEEEVWGI